MFLGGTNGVWVGSRMGENTLPMDCTDPAYVDEPLRRVVLDRATDNVVRGNRFVDVTYGIRVEDDGNVVEGNTFDGDGPDHHAVIVGTPLRTDGAGPPGHAARSCVDNVSTIAGNDDPYRWVTGQVGTRSSRGNTALGAPAALVPGRRAAPLALRLRHRRRPRRPRRRPPGHHARPHRPGPRRPPTLHLDRNLQGAPGPSRAHGA